METEIQQTFRMGTLPEDIIHATQEVFTEIVIQDTDILLFSRKPAQGDAPEVQIRIASQVVPGLRIFPLQARNCQATVWSRTRPFARLPILGFRLRFTPISSVFTGFDKVGVRHLR